MRQSLWDSVSESALDEEGDMEGLVIPLRTEASSQGLQAGRSSKMVVFSFIQDPGMLYHPHYSTLYASW